MNKRNTESGAAGRPWEYSDGIHVARIFDQLRPLFDRSVLVPPAIRTWPLENAAQAYQTAQDGSAGIKQVLLPAGRGTREKSR